MRIFLLFIFSFSLLSCEEEALFQDSVRHNMWMFHKGAELPVVVEGNTNSKVFLLLLHGGPGGSAQEYNSFNNPFTQPLEDNYAMVYYDQRNAGMARGEWDPALYTIDQHIEDLEQIIKLLRFKFGEDIKLFLAGHSWGAYLGTAFLTKESNQDGIIAWLNIDGAINRNQNYKDRLIHIKKIAEERIALNSFTNEWMAVLDDIQLENEKQTIQYDAEKEKGLNKIMSTAESILGRSDLFEVNVDSYFDGIFSNNFHPFIDNANGFRNKVPLINQMYSPFDKRIEENLFKLTLPVFCIYGYYDLRTPFQQSSFLLNAVSTSDVEKKELILMASGHSPMRTQPEILAAAIMEWVEKYK